MKTLCVALLTAALAAMALVATAASRLFGGRGEYEQYEWFTECPWKAESVQKALEVLTEKVIQINKSIQNTLFEIKNSITSRLENPFLLGDNCYVGYQELIDNGDLPATITGSKKAGPNSSRAGVEKSNQIEIFYELSQLKTHLA